MDFELTDDQEALQHGVRSLLDGRYPIEAVRAYEAGELDRARWGELADAGVFSLRLDADAGGVGLGSTEAVLVFEELGRHLIPGPVVATHLAAPLVDGAAEGTTVVGVVEQGADAEPVLVEHLDSLDALLAVDRGRVLRLDVTEVAAAATPVARPTDPLTPIHRLDLLPPGEVVLEGGAAERFVDEGAVFTAALQLGLALRATEISTDYARERHQFGRPIGGFQAVKHMLADMLVGAEVARAAVYSAAVHLDDPGIGDVARAVSTAKIVAGDVAVKNGKTAIQIHGGMGFSWEVDAHLLLKRAWVLDTQFGSSDEHSLAMADAL